jgi:CBS domain-containing protein
MKQLKSTYRDLHDLFGHDIKAKHILEHLRSCRAEENATTVGRRMEKLDFDVMGIKEDGTVNGYVEQSSLKTGPCGNYRIGFVVSELLEESTPLIEVFSGLHDATRRFVTKRKKVIGIVTRGDLQKAPIRMWLFGLITLLEMHLLRVIRSHFPADSWAIHLSNGRIANARKIFTSRKERNEAIDLVDCLQFFDKRELVLKIPEIKESMRKYGGESADTVLESAEMLRDKLCHAQDIVKGSTWPEVIDLAKNIEHILEFFERCE